MRVHSQSRLGTVGSLGVPKPFSSRYQRPSSRAIDMDELAIARTKLAHLEEDERQLLEQLSDVRVAAVAQSKRTRNRCVKDHHPSPPCRITLVNSASCSPWNRLYAKEDPGTCMAALEGCDAEPAKFPVYGGDWWWTAIGSRKGITHILGQSW
ncbi:hypothetical protein F5J12DRAFT_49953 [Pisolithus orientalis]|uniref:uncharacterized protein n=1 Tax=Pisolithus orientalis TaxID=936130 RepID=UPI002224837E|nr:uncharacterized protein F5J12DRAFT_49953 [Pisolithus orientalis]KAI6008727.1 hypothetical protein F5J12DRAFT_49953 [Pisolithus orientalis]